MDCATVRQRMDEGQTEHSVLEHLESCPACRAEVEFDRRVAAAVALMPRVQAPPTLLGSVMAELRPTAPVHRPISPRPPLSLRAWEMGWLGAACLLLIALIPAAFARWVGAG